mmetsp:Transcript_22241/g.70082  ORF Transcript_22241/g.70082 Transcript_22241/m.70082 type:complete len:584 (-) Transcript_22241:83-1834(-)
MRTILFCLLRHQPDIGHGAHGGDVEGTVLLAIRNHLLVDAGVAAVRDHGLRVMPCVLRGPHLAGVPDHGGHGRIDDDVARHVEVGDAPVGVDHGQLGALGVRGLDVRLDGVALPLGQLPDLAVEVAEAVVGVHAERLEGRSVLLEDVLEEDGDHVAEHDGVGHLHHRGLEMQRPQGVLVAGLQLLLIELLQRLDAHDAGVNDLAWQKGSLGLQDLRALSRDKLDADAADLLHHRGLLAGEEVAVGHVGHVRLRVRGPRPDLVRMLLRVGLDGLRRAAVRVTLAEHRVHGATKDLGVPHVVVDLLLRLGVHGVVRHRVALGLKLLDGSYELRHRRGDVRELDDAGRGILRELAHPIQVVIDALLQGQGIGEVGQDAACEGDVLFQDLDVAHAAERAEHGQQGVGGEHGSLVGVGVNYLHVWDAELDVVAVPVRPLHDPELGTLGQLVEPLRELDRAILVFVELHKELVHVDLASWEVQLLQGSPKLLGVQRTASVAVVPRKGLRQDRELLLGGLSSCLNLLRDLAEAAGRWCDDGSRLPELGLRDRRRQLARWTRECPAANCPSACWARQHLLALPLIEVTHKF